MSHRTLSTASSVVVTHSHPETNYEHTDAQKASYQSQTLAGYPGIVPVTYVHLDHSSEVLLPTRRYNCWGFTFNPRQCWISSGSDVQNILNGNGTQVMPPNLRVGDVICYRDSYNTITHTGRVWSLTSAGQAALIQSKWGALGEYLHPPLTVPASYGTNVTYWRVTPLTGKGDAWHKDNAGDDRLPDPPGVKWLSLDLWCNNSGGTTHQNPVRYVSNQLYARLHNPDTLPINNATVRIYWADPNGGIPHSDWHLISTAAVSVSPAGNAVAGPVYWTPDDTVPAHTCLLAIADTGDNPFAAATLDPIVWPFDIARDNNVIQKNIGVITLAPKPSPRSLTVYFTAKNPFAVKLPVEVHIDVQPMRFRDLGDLGLDVQSFVPTVDMLTAAPERTHRVLRPRPPMEINVAPDGDLWRQKGGRLSEKGMVLNTSPVPHGKGGRLKLKLTPTANTRTAEIYRIDLEQQVGGEITGGMTYLVIVGEKSKTKE